MDDAPPTVDAPTKPPQRFRRTRIAVSVFFGVLTVALCVLWVRSNWWADTFSFPITSIRRMQNPHWENTAQCGYWHSTG